MRRLVHALALVFLTCQVATPAHAGWSGDPVQISSASPIPLVEACNDGAYGSFVAWQEGAVLHVQHLLPSGDLDPSWPASGAIACDVVADRTDLVLLPDRLGGLYLSWRESNSLYLTRLDASGATPSAWPTRGRSLGSATFPALVSDDAHGVFVAWGVAASLWMIHLGPDNTDTGGWSAGAHAVQTPTSTVAGHVWPALAPDAAGGTYLSWLKISRDEQVLPTAACIVRLGPDGQPSPGWAAQGLSFAPFQWTLSPSLPARLIDVAEDGSGGAYLLACEPVENQGLVQVDLRLRRVTAAAGLAPGWPAEGRSNLPLADVIDDATAPQVRFAEADAAVVSRPMYYSEGITSMEYWRCPDQGNLAFLGSAEPHAGRRVVPTGRGGFFFATFKPSGPYSMWEAYAQLRLSQGPAPAGWSDFSEYYTNPVIQIYGDIGLAQTGDGGAVLFWSQVYDRIGLFARRFGPAGETLDVGSEPATLGIESARFLPGSGVRVRFSTGAQGAARLELFDVVGRRVARMHAGVASGARDAAIPGTAALPSGLYFLRLTAGDGAARARVAVVR